MKIYFGGVKTIANCFDDYKQMYDFGIRNLLGSFWSKDEVKELLNLYETGLGFDLFLDSGAFSLRRKAEKEGKESFYGTDMFNDYLQKYLDFLKFNSNKFSIYVTLDIIFDWEKTYEVYKKFKENGLNPLPVLHVGTRPEVLDKYIALGGDYIGLGGVGRVGVLDKYHRWADSVFAYIMKNYKGIKVHGFAMTAPSLASQYPFYSVDSVSALLFSAYGTIVIIDSQMKFYGLYVSDRIRNTAELGEVFDCQGVSKSNVVSKNNLSKEEEKFWRDLCERRNIDYDNLDGKSRLKFNLLSMLEFQNKITKHKDIFQSVIEF